MSESNSASQNEATSVNNSSNPYSSSNQDSISSSGDSSPSQLESQSLDATPLGTLVTRSFFGGALMGLANLVPGVSGGTMLLAAGVYPAFIKSVSNLTRFRLNFRTLLVLSCVALSAGLGILLFAETLKDLVVHQRWIMYSLFIGLTLGGVPLVWRLAHPVKLSLWISGVLAFAAMAALAFLKADQASSGENNFLMLAVAGLAGSSAMILPGLSGGYLLLLLRQYVPILDGISRFKDALTSGDFSAAMEPAWGVMLPVGIGVVVGIVAVGNLLEWLLREYQQVTLGLLLGLLLGSVVGLYPFQQPVAPSVGSVVKGEIVTVESLAEIDKEDWPTETFQPTGGQIGGSAGLVLLGLVITLGVAAIGKGKPDKD